MLSAARQTQNWDAYLELDLVVGEEKTLLVPIKRCGPLSVQRPFYPEQETCHVYLLHPPGGVVGGDSLELRLRSQSQSRALLTTPGATKFYLSAGDTATVNQHLDIQDQSVNEYLPQENIYFPGARVHAKTAMHIEGTGVGLLWEKHCFGRPVNDEAFDEGQVITELNVFHDKQRVYTEKQKVDAQEIKRSSGLRGNPVMGTFVLFGHQLDRSTVRELSAIAAEKGYCGITQPGEKLLIARYMGQSTSDLDSYFIRLWQHCRPLMVQKEPVQPRIWAT